MLPQEKELFDKITNEFVEYSDNMSKWLDKGNKAAAGRARKASLNLRKLFKEWKAVNVIESNS